MVIKQIKKRDGAIVDFDKEKITNAILKAVKAVGGHDRKEAERISNLVTDYLDERYHETIPSVEEIQDAVEKILIEEGHAKTAKAYILYRKQHQEMREFSTLLSSINLVDDYITQTDWRVKENSNMNFSLQGLNNYISSKIIADYWLDKLYDEKIKNAHKDCFFHIHDLGTLGPYCVGWSIRDLLLLGFRGVSGKVETKPARHFRSALGQIINFFYTMQGEAAGAQALSNFDSYLVPFIRFDKLDYKGVKQCIQEFAFNMNVPTRVGFQTPFSNITLDLNIPNFMKNEPVIIGGKLIDQEYGEFNEEMALLNQAFAEVMADGDALGRVFTFPIPTYNITKDFDWDNKTYDMIWEMTAKYGIPYFSNFINSDMKPEDARSMCCRLRLDNRELRKRGGGLFGANPLTGSIGVVTINMPKLGYLNKNEDDFFNMLAEVMDTAKNSLEIKRKVLERYTEDGLYPYSKFYLKEVKNEFNCYWKNHFSTIGLNGMNECLMNFMGITIAKKDGINFALKTLKFMRDKLADYQEETGNLYNLEATPAEGTAYRLAKRDKELYPEIIVANNEAVAKNAAPYYTNSTHLPVGYTDDIFEALELQDELQTMYTGGTVLHGFIGDRMPNAESTKLLVKQIAKNFRLPYYTITPTFSICPKHGYLSGEHEYCPICDDEIGFC